jgi:hypothetical protein
MATEQETTTEQDVNATLDVHPHEEADSEVEMCCDGSGRTAEQHRAESADHKCCIDG